MIAVTPTGVTVQIPWEVAALNLIERPVALEVRTGDTNSPFAFGTKASALTEAAWGTFVPNPTIIRPGEVDVVAVHEDWSSLVTVDNPAHPTEILHIYGSGFGRVAHPPPTGMPSSADPLAPTTVPVTCWTWGADNVSQLQMSVLFSGLAPGLVGYYQLDIRLPAGNLRSEWIQFYCNGEGNVTYPYSGDFMGWFAVKP